MNASEQYSLASQIHSQEPDHPFTDVVPQLLAPEPEESNISTLGEVETTDKFPAKFPATETQAQETIDPIQLEDPDPILEPTDPKIGDPALDIPPEPKVPQSGYEGELTPAPIQVPVPAPDKPIAGGIETPTAHADPSNLIRPTDYLLDVGVWGGFDETSFEILKWDAYQLKQLGTPQGEEAADAMVISMANKMAYDQLTEEANETGIPISELIDTPAHQQIFEEAVNNLTTELQKEPRRPLFYTLGITGALRSASDMLPFVPGRPEIKPTHMQQMAGGALAGFTYAAAMPLVAYTPWLGPLLAPALPPLTLTTVGGAIVGGGVEGVIDPYAQDYIDQIPSSKQWLAQTGYTILQMAGIGAVELGSEHLFKKSGQFFRLNPYGQKLNVVKHAEAILNVTKARMMTMGDPTNPSLMEFRRNVIRGLVERGELGDDGLLELAKLEAQIVAGAEARLQHPKRKNTGVGIFLDKSVLTLERDEFRKIIYGANGQAYQEDISVSAGMIMFNDSMPKFLQSLGVDNLSPSGFSEADIAKLSEKLANLDPDSTDAKILSILLKYKKLPAKMSDIGQQDVELVFRTLFDDFGEPRDLDDPVVLSKRAQGLLSSRSDLENVMMSVEIANVLVKEMYESGVDDLFPGYMASQWGFTRGENSAYEALMTRETDALNTQWNTLVARETEPGTRPEVQIDPKIQQIFNEAKEVGDLSFDPRKLAESRIKQRMVEQTKHMPVLPPLLNEVNIGAIWGRDQIIINRAVSISQLDRSKIKTVKPMTFDPASVHTEVGIKQSVENLAKSVKKMGNYDLNVPRPNRVIRAAQLLGIFETPVGMTQMETYDALAVATNEVAQMPLSSRQGMTKAFQDVTAETELPTPGTAPAPEVRIDPIVEVQTLIKQGKAPPEIQATYEQFRRADELAGKKNDPSSWGTDSDRVNLDLLQHLYDNVGKEPVTDIQGVLKAVTKAAEADPTLAPLVQKLQNGETPTANEITAIRDIITSERYDFADTNIDEALTIVKSAKSMDEGLIEASPQSLERLELSLLAEKNDQGLGRGAEYRSPEFKQQQAKRAEKLTNWVRDQKAPPIKDAPLTAEATKSIEDLKRLPELMVDGEGNLLSPEDQATAQKYIDTLISQAEFQGFTTDAQKLTWIKKEMKSFFPAAAGELPVTKTLIEKLYKGEPEERATAVLDILANPQDPNYDPLVQSIQRKIDALPEKEKKVAQAQFNRTKEQYKRPAWSLDKGTSPDYEYKPAEPRPTKSIDNADIIEALTQLEAELIKPDSLVPGMWMAWKEGNISGLDPKYYRMFESLDAAERLLGHRVSKMFGGDPKDFDIMSDKNLSALLATDQLISADKNQLKGTGFETSIDLMRLAFDDWLNNTNHLNDTLRAFKESEIRQFSNAYNQAIWGKDSPSDLTPEKILELENAAKAQYESLVTTSNLIDTQKGKALTAGIKFNPETGRLEIPEELMNLGMPDIRPVIDSGGLNEPSDVFGEIRYKQIMSRAGQIYESAGATITEVAASHGRLPPDLNVLQTSIGAPSDIKNLAENMSEYAPPVNRVYKVTVKNRLGLERVSQDLSPEATKALYELHQEAYGNLSRLLTRLESSSAGKRIKQALPNQDSVYMDNHGVIIDILMFRKQLLQIRAIEETIETGAVSARTSRSLQMYNFDLSSPEALVKSVTDMSVHAFPELTGPKSTLGNSQLTLGKAINEDMAAIELITHTIRLTGGEDVNSSLKAGKVSKHAMRQSRNFLDTLYRKTDNMRASKAETKRVTQAYDTAQEEMVPDIPETRTPYKQEKDILFGDEENLEVELD